MTQDEFRAAMAYASRTNQLCYLMHGEAEVIAVGYNSGTDVAILFKPGGQYEVPLAELREGFE